ncbi:flagellar motor switch phosphatase FliY [Lysinibacillus sp. SGAir0095]|uniref:flagellar motor switch phosphatase FliY n=1 Tax=Lysinibacillus sp. SGAir0095 TaxID=2070463 RepID=UPI0010CD256F|nr:flagellar motor switch phosphatase FliY [Lysinibacillus sp. SGAir0095]QCR31806.1 flagellar motor switch phosphatase FliY [Lysinibacillus sp. SGAir0095]
MSDGMLSQEEIEALLRGESLEDKMNDLTSESSTNNEPLRVEDYLDPMEQDALGEVGNISFGSSATALSTLLGQKVDITTPVVSILNRNFLEEEFPHPYVAVQVEYTTGLSGANLLVIKQEDAAIIADLMLGGDGLNPSIDLSEIQLSAVQEAMNQMMGSAATSMSTVFNKKVDISPPTIDLMNISQNEGTEQIPEDDLLVKVSFRLKIGSLIDSNLMQLFPLQFGKKLVKSLLGEEETSGPAAVQKPADNQQPVTPSQPVHQQPVQQQPIQQPVQQQPVYQQPPVYQQQAATTYQEPPTSYAMPTYQQPQQPVNVQQAQFASFENAPITQDEARNLNMLLDIPLQVTVELGRTKHSVKEILQLASGSIIELDKLAGEPVDILVNSRLIAKGEVVVIDENFGVRITDIMSQAERLNNLK